MDDGSTKYFWCRGLVRSEELEESGPHLELLGLVGHFCKACIGENHSSEENASKDARLEWKGRRADDADGESNGIVGLSGTKLVKG